MVSGGVVAATVLLFGQSLLNLAGILHSVDSIIGSRMSSLLQYSNTFALVCTVGVLAAAALALRGDRWWALWHLGFNIGVSGIILSQSRAMYLLLPILLLLWGFFVGRSVVGEVVFYAFDSLAALLIGLVLYIPSNNQLSRSPWVLGVTAILWVMSYYGVILLRVLVQRLGRNSRVAAWATGGLLLIAFAGVFIRFSQSIFTRLGSLKLSDPAVLGRIYTLIDGLRIVQAHPLGLGVDGWRASYFKYASYFYITNAAHSYWIEVAVSAGALGIFALLFVLVVWASRLWRRMRQLPTQSDLGYATNLAIALGTVAIIVHSAIDWDLAFLSLLLFFWFLVGYVDGWSVPAPLARPTGLNRPVVAVVGLAVMTVVAMQWSGDGALNQGVRLLQQKNYSQAIDNLHKAAARDPWNGFTHADLAMAYIAAAPPKDPQAEHMAEQELELARRYDRMNYQTYIRQGRFYRQRERFVEAEHAMKEAVSVGPWRPDAWANLVSVYTKAVEVAIKRGDSDAVTRWVLAGRDALRSYEQQLTTQPAFTQNNAAVRFPENDPDLTQSLADFRKIQAAVPQA